MDSLNFVLVILFGGVFSFFFSLQMMHAEGSDHKAGRCGGWRMDMHMRGYVFFS